MEEMAKSRQTASEVLGPPKKRRKLLHRVHSKDPDDARWEDHLTLARVEIGLVFDQIPFESSGNPVPVGVRSSSPVLLRLLMYSEDGGAHCELRTMENNTLGIFRLQSPIEPQTRRFLKIATSLCCASKRSSAKALCEITRSDHELPYSRYVLQIKIIWRNSKSFEDSRSDGQNDILTMLAPGEGLYKVESWSPRDFYESVHVPPNDIDTAGLTVDGLVCQLYPFQKRAIRWLLSREGVNLEGKNDTDRDSNSKQSGLPHGFFGTKDVDGRSCFVSYWLGMVTTDKSLVIGVDTQLKGGILAEEMGLGKTVEVIALICSHRRGGPSNAVFDSEANLRSSAATLIIAPPSILQQWKSEIQNHAPGLKVMIYEGIHSFDKHADDEEMLQQLLEQDVVLTTYHILGKEIHYSSATPERKMRHGKKYERRQSPLVRIDWWRVVLDECQMVESGISNAARVAQLVPRQNAWAVSGTPLKRDAKDLLGLLIFLRLEPYCLWSAGWGRLVTSYKPIFKDLFRRIALRHTKEQVKRDLQLPPQKRVVLSIPFTQIEEQHYATIYQQMCEECELNKDGQPLTDDWDPNSSAVVERMRTWLTRLRQTCLHPEVGDRNRRALGRSNGPLRTVGEVLQVMIEQNDSASRAEERSYLLSKLRRGQLLEHVDRSEDALTIWLDVLQNARSIVEDSRQEMFSSELLAKQSETSNARDAEESNIRLPPRLRLRSALEVEHTATFFVANAYFQIKSDEKKTLVDSERFKELEELEIQTYEKAKALREEMLAETQKKADGLMLSIKVKASTQAFTQIPNFSSSSIAGGIESRNVLSKLADLSDMINEQAEIVDEWREKMIELLLLPLVDQEDSELKGDEYETSTKQQDEVYVYMEALRAAVADRHDVLTGQHNILIRGEMTTALQQAIRGEGHSPELMRRLLSIRSKLKPKEELSSIRGIITELRALKTSLRPLEDRGSSRTSAEIAIINKALETLQLDAAKQFKAVAGLNKEVEIFRDAMNARLEYYRQLQTISDAVAPYERELNEEALEAAIAKMKANEVKLQEKVSTLKARGRYLVHLRAESSSEEVQRKCIICQELFEIGALTSCGHSYCKECLRLWFNAHRNCPTCKKHLSKNDLFQITYKPQEMTVQEEEAHASPSGSDSDVPASSIYSGINSLTLNQIKNIDVDGSFGTKIDTLARHILWIRENDPDAKSVLFSQFKDFLDVLARAFTKFKIGFASIDMKNGVENFKRDPGIECFFLHAKAHSSGLNLVNATHVFLCEPLINTALELQAIARVHRIGQYHSTTVWMYLVEDTVEKAIYDISVTRRLAHIGRSVQKSASSDLGEDDLEAANSLELQEAPLSKLLTKGPGGGEMVEKEDLWNCLFQQRLATKVIVSEEAERVASRFLGASASEERQPERPIGVLSM
ncbi:hypothetical protein MMC13_000500 [Lambiella insularis]|nr:hypothetical protein [Lambiella insularis]